MTKVELRVHAAHIGDGLHGVAVNSNAWSSRSWDQSRIRRRLPPGAASGNSKDLCAGTVLVTGENEREQLGSDLQITPFAMRKFTGTKPLASVDMNSKSNASSTKSSRSKRSRQSRRLVLCLKNNGYEVSLERRKLYEAIPDRAAAAHSQLRVIDESGEDYLYPASHFAAIVLSRSLRKALLAS